MATVAQQPQTFADWLSGAVYGTSKWSGSTAADLFVPAGTVIRAPIAGTVSSSSASGPEGSHPIIYLRGDDGTVLRFLHDQATASGHVQAGQPIGTVGDSTLTAAYQHVDLSVSRTGNFQAGPGGGEIDARQWLASIGFKGTQIQGRTGGIQEMLAGQPPYPGYGSGGQPGGASLLGGLSGADYSSLTSGASGGSTGAAATTPAPAAVAFANPFAQLGEGFSDFPKWGLAAVGVGAVVLAVEQGDSKSAGVLALVTLGSIIVLNKNVQEQLLSLTNGTFGQVGAGKLASILGSGAGSGSAATAARGTGSLPGASTGLPASGNASILAAGDTGILGSIPARIAFPYHGTPYSFGGLTSHQGVDLTAASGSTAGDPFYLPAGFGAGTVAAVLPEGTGPGTSGSGGQGIIVRLAGALQGFFAHFYHVGQAAVAVGQPVNPGQRLGTVGYAAPGDSHLHVELRNTTGIGGSTVDPTQYLKGVLR